MVLRLEVCYGDAEEVGSELLVVICSSVMFRKNAAVYSQDQIKPIKGLWGYMPSYCTLKAVGTDSYHQRIKGYKKVRLSSLQTVLLFPVIAPSEIKSEHACCS